MTTVPMNRAIKDLCHRMEAEHAAELTDRQLLQSFAGEQDEGAFAMLVRRHGPMVLNVCGRVLRNRHDSEDAFQAVFLVLARKAGWVGWHDSVGGWLFRVAHHVALKMKANANRCRTQALPPDLPQAEAVSGLPGWELPLILDEELSRLPTHYRTALVLCHYEGKSRSQAAQELGWKEGTLKIRLERARQLLRVRLTRRGLALSAALAGYLLGENALPAAVPAALVDTTVTAARVFAPGSLPAVVSPPAVLAEGVFAP